MLLVDDSATNRLVAQHYLQRMGLVVETADSGLAAVELAASRSYDAVLMDLQMPDMDGCAAARAIRAHGQCQAAGNDGGDGRLPIIALTAASMPDDIERARAAGMDAFLSKPIDLTQLAATLRGCLPARDQVQP